MNRPIALLAALVALLAGSHLTAAQDADDSLPSQTITTAPQAAAQEPAQTSRDDSRLRALRSLVISADGAWAAAEEHPDRGDGDVRVWSTERDVSFTIERGRDPRISRDSRWVSALQRPPPEGARATRPTNRREGQTLVLLDLRDGSRRTFDSVLSYDMTYASTYLLYLQSPETKADEESPSKDGASEPAAKERTAGTLHQIPLDRARLDRIGLRHPGSSYTTENVTQFVAHPTNDHFAYVFHDEETGGDTLRIVKWGIRSWYHGEKIEGLSWAGGHRRHPDLADGVSGGDETITLGFLDTETTAKDGGRRVTSALYAWRPARSSFGKFTRVDTPQ